MIKKILLPLLLFNLGDLTAVEAVKPAAQANVIVISAVDQGYAGLGVQRQMKDIRSQTAKSGMTTWAMTNVC